jgi:Zn-dependent protease/CBS domain-containing protein
MRDGIKIGRIFGIDIIVDYSWLLIFVLVSWNLTLAFRTWHPAWSGGESIALAVVAALLFFGSVLLHELAHSLVAGSFGMSVHEIRLFLFGGVSNLEGEPPSAKAEFWTAIIGPVVSIGLGFDLLLASSFFVSHDVDPDQGWNLFVGLGPLATLLMWLGAVNVGVGIFNLIPGFPLDGGRVLRAALWAVTRDLHRATLRASNVGQAIGWAFVVMGIAMFFGARVPFFGRGIASGLWLAFIGWFLASAATRSYRGFLMQEMLGGVTVGRLMRSSGIAFPPDTTVDDAVRRGFMRSEQRAFPILEEGRLVGLLTVSDLRKVDESEWSRRVSELMTPASELEVTTPNEEALSAMKKLAQKDLEELPVVEGANLVGMLERRDLARFIELKIRPHGFSAPRQPPKPRHA